MIKARYIIDAIIVPTFTGVLPVVFATTLDPAERRPHSRCPVRSRPSPRCSRCSPRGCWSWRSPSPSLGRRRSSLAPLSRRDRLGKGRPPGSSHHWRGWPHHRFSPCMEATYPYDIKNQRKARNTPSRGRFVGALGALSWFFMA